MPVWRISCVSCGHDESAITSLRQREAAGGMIPCARCGTLADARPTAPIIHSSERIIKASGMEFSSAKALDAYADKQGMQAVSKGTQTYNEFREQTRARSDALAKKHGFADTEDRQRRMKDPDVKRQHDLRLAAKQAETFKKKHGSAEAPTPEKALKTITGGTP